MIPRTLPEASGRRLCYHNAGIMHRIDSENQVSTPPRQERKQRTVSGIWGRSFWTWVIPLLRVGHANIIRIASIPRVDYDLQEEPTRTKLDAAWQGMQGHRHGLLRAAFTANIWPFFSAVPPRLLLTAFTFCQPFFINSSVSYLNNRPAADHASSYGNALIGACVLIYLGVAV